MPLHMFSVMRAAKFLRQLPVKTQFGMTRQLSLQAVCGPQVATYANIGLNMFERSTRKTSLAYPEAQCVSASDLEVSSGVNIKLPATTKETVVSSE